MNEYAIIPYPTNSKTYKFQYNNDEIIRAYESILNKYIFKYDFIKDYSKYNYSVYDNMIRKEYKKRELLLEGWPDKYRKDKEDENIKEILIDDTEIDLFSSVYFLKSEIDKGFNNLTEKDWNRALKRKII